MPAEAELAHRPATSAGVVVGVATGPTSAAAVAAGTVDVMAVAVVAMAIEATDAEATHVIDVADHPQPMEETEGVVGAIHGKWKDAKEGASFASKKDTLRHTALKKAAEEEIRETVPLMVATDAETIACVAATTEMALPAAKCRGAAHRQESAPKTTAAESTVPVTDRTTAHANAPNAGITVLVTEALHPAEALPPVATTEEMTTVEALATETERGSTIQKGITRKLFASACHGCRSSERCSVSLLHRLAQAKLTLSITSALKHYSTATHKTTTSHCFPPPPCTQPETPERTQV